MAGIWEHKKDGPNGLPLLSFSMLTVNADRHDLMQRFHKPEDEKRMLVILQPGKYGDCLFCDVGTPEKQADLKVGFSPIRSEEVLHEEVAFFGEPDYYHLLPFSRRRKPARRSRSRVASKE